MHFSTLLTLVLSLALPCLTWAWISVYLDGIGSGRRLFNAHPLLMTLGFGPMFAQAVLAYRTSQSINQSMTQRQSAQSFNQSLNVYDPSIQGPISHTMAKAYHSLMHSLAGLSWIAGFIIVYIYHANQSIAHFKSLHSWLGLITLSLFLSNYIAGFVSFVYPKLSYQRRVKLVPVHAWIGRSLIICLTATMTAGLVEKYGFELMGGAVATGERILINFIGLTILALGVLLLSLLSSRSSTMGNRNEDSDGDDISVERFDDAEEVGETTRLVTNNRTYSAFKDPMTALIDETAAAIMAIDAEEDTPPIGQFSSFRSSKPAKQINITRTPARDEKKVSHATSSSKLIEGESSDTESIASQPGANYSTPELIDAFNGIQTNKQLISAKRRSSESMWPVFRGIDKNGIILGSPED